jgi:hypothetical protein
MTLLWRLRAALGHQADQEFVSSTWTGNAAFAFDLLPNETSAAGPKV